MAGKKGRSGGARPNTGGARKGAGRKPKTPPPETFTSPDGVERTPLEFLQAVMNGRIEATLIQVRAAIAAAQYVHAKKGEGGKKESDTDAAAKIAAAGKFAPAASPRVN